MSKIAQRLTAIKPSPTVAITARANQMKADGADVIGLAAGEPDFDTPTHITEAAYQAMLSGKTRYAPPAGIPQLRKAIAAKFQRENRLDYDPEQVTIGVGGKQIIFNALLATVEEGDEVIIPAPYWVSYPDIALMMGGKPVFIACPAEQGFKLTPADLQAAITPRSKWLILNSPSNPSGAAYNRTELEAIAAVLLKPENAHITILTDDIYEHVIYDNFVFSTLAEIAPALKERVLTVNGLAKAYCMTGWRLGYAAGPSWLIKAMNMINSQSITSLPTFVQWAGVAALEGPNEFIEAHNQQFRQRRDFVVEAINRIEGLHCRQPEGAFYVYPRCAGLLGRKTPKGKLINSDSDFISYLLESEGLAMVQGEAFGLSPYFRISYATSMETLAEAMKRLSRACGQLKG